MYTTYTDPFVSRVWTFQASTKSAGPRTSAVSGTGTMPRAAGIARMTSPSRGTAPTGARSPDLAHPRGPGSVVTIKGEHRPPESSTCEPRRRRTTSDRAERAKPLPRRSGRGLVATGRGRGAVRSTHQVSIG